MELILMRHGTTQGNLERRFIGTLDVPLLPLGEELARRVGATLPAVEHIYRSPLQRPGALSALPPLSLYVHLPWCLRASPRAARC